MNEVVALLQAEQSEVLRVGLSGHLGDHSSFGQVTRKQWLHELNEAYHRAAARANELHVPIFFVGYSLGALLALDLMSQNAKIRFDRMVLFAPPLSIKIPRFLIRFARCLLGKGFVVPSFSPNSYRANHGTTLAAYVALIDSLQALRKSGFAHLQKVPTLVLIDLKDELVSYRGVKSELSKFGFSTEWKILPLKEHSSQTPHHLIIDSEAVGTKEWNQIKNWIHQQLFQAEISVQNGTN